MHKREKLWITLGLIFAAAPIAAVMIYLILKPQDFSRPVVWLLVLLLIAMFFWQEIVQRTYRPGLDRWLEGKHRFLHLFADEFEKIFPFGLFIAGYLLVDKEAPSHFGWSAPFSVFYIFAFITLISAVWSGGRLYLERRKLRSK